MTRKELKELVGQTYRQEGDAIAGERIIAQARKLVRQGVVAGTSSHKMQQVILKTNALCVIDKSFRIAGEDDSFRLAGEPDKK